VRAGAALLAKPPPQSSRGAIEQRVCTNARFDSAQSPRMPDEVDGVRGAQPSEIEVRAATSADR
jgi:hypothetical protein